MDGSLVRRRAGGGYEEAAEVCSCGGLGSLSDGPGGEERRDYRVSYWRQSDFFVRSRTAEAGLVDQSPRT
jgi:hypothetical protein